MLEPDFDPAPTAVQIGRCGYACPCRAPRCAESRATIVLRKIDAAGRPVRQIEPNNGMSLRDLGAIALISRTPLQRGRQASGRPEIVLKSVVIAVRFGSG